MNLPNGWKYVKLSDISTELTETAGNQEYETLSISAGIGFVNQAKKFGKELSGKQYEKYIVLHEGDFSYNKGNSKKYPQGCIYQLKNRKVAAVPNVFESFRLKIGNNDFYEQLFISGFLNKQLTSKINHGVRDDGLLNLTGKDFYNCIIPFPPLAEQQKIAQILTKQDELISLKEKLLEQKQQQKKWLMQKLLEVARENSECAKNFSISGVVINKNEWKKEKLGNICDVKGGKRIPKGYQLQSMNNGYPYITVSDMKNGTVFLKGISYVPIEVVKGISQYTISKDDIYISVAGTLGEVGIIPAELDGANLTENADKLTNIKCNKQFLLFLMQSNVVQNQIENSKTNNAQPKLAIEQIKQFDFFLPTLPEQKIIAQVLSAADKEIDLLKQEIEFQKQKKKALAQQLLFGKARVKT